MSSFNIDFTGSFMLTLDRYYYLWIFGVTEFGFLTNFESVNGFLFLY